MIKTIKELLKEMKEIKKEGKTNTYIAYNKNWNPSIYNVCDYDYIEDTYKISQIHFTEKDNVIKVDNIEEFKKAILNFKDVKSASILSKNRIDFYYKNGRRALIVLNI